MNELSDDDIDGLLREAFDGPVPADAFCDQVMARLPARRRRYKWPLAAGIIAGFVMCWLSLTSALIARIGWHDWLSGEPSAPAILLLLTMTGFSLLALVWTVAEADDRRDQPSRRA